MYTYPCNTFFLTFNLNFFFSGTLIYNRFSIGFISRSYVLGLYLAEKGTRLSGIFDYPEAAKSHDSQIIGTCL